ncbi:MAG TPA: hypothetical protein VGM84_17305 [Steroidobacteraceae bacterium]|jgi:hypothetical protein
MRTKQVVVALSVLGIVCAGGAAMSLRAAEQKPVPAAKAAPASQPTAAKPAAPAQKPPAGAPEEDATIKDDPTVAPDPQQSADSSVSFPADI